MSLTAQIVPKATRSCVHSQEDCDCTTCIPADMVEEEERRQHITILGSLYKVLQERKHAGTSQGNASETADGPSNEESTDLSRLVAASSPENSECGSTDFQPVVSINVDEAMPNTSGGNIEVCSETGMKGAAGSTQRDKRKGIGTVFGDANRGEKTSGERGHKCETCGLSFNQNHYLADHRCIHAGDQPFYCTECGRSFTQKASLVVHNRIHTGEKPFKCPACPKSFRKLSDVRVHERTHTGERPYKCEICDYTLKTSSNLKRHQRTHKNKKT